MTSGTPTKRGAEGIRPAVVSGLARALASAWRRAHRIDGQESSLGAPRSASDERPIVPKEGRQ